MNPPVKWPLVAILTTLAVIASPLVIWFVANEALPIASGFFQMDRQMKAGKRYMDSLSETEIQPWIQRAEKLLAEHGHPFRPAGGVPVPDDLATLGILRIDVLPPNGVWFVWVSGLDHTHLAVERTAEGNHIVTACYDDETTRQLWPKVDTGAPSR